MFLCFDEEKARASEEDFREIQAKSTLPLSGLGSGRRLRVDPEQGFFDPPCKAGLGATEWVKDKDSTPEDSTVDFFVRSDKKAI